MYTNSSTLQCMELCLLFYYSSRFQLNKRKKCHFPIIIFFSFALLLEDSGKNEKKSYMRYYVPYKPGDEFKYRTPAGE